LADKISKYIKYYRTINSLGIVRSIAVNTINFPKPQITCF